MNIDKRYELMSRNLQEVLGDPNEVKKILAERAPRVYWGTACTSRIHIGYFVQMLKIADYLQADCEVTILLADLHAYLDNMKSSLELINYRTQYYTRMIQAILESMGIDISKLRFIKGTSYQLSEKYTMDVYRANSMITVKEAQHAGAEVVKQTDNPTMNGLLYPTLQALDEEYLGIDIETSGIDQRKIVTHSKSIMPKLGYKKRIYFMTEMVPGLRTVKKMEQSHNVIVPLNKSEYNSILEDSSLKDEQIVDKLQILIDKYRKDQALTQNIQLEKMSSSNHESKIDLLDTKNQIKSKINKCYCLPGDIEDNCLLTILEKMLFPMLKYKKLDFVINRKEKFGGPIVYTSIIDVINDFQNETLHPGDFKLGMIDSFDLILEPIRKIFNTPDLQHLLKLSYP